MKKIIITTLSTILIFTINFCFSYDNDKLNTFYLHDEYISDINLPWIKEYNYGWWNQLFLIAKEIFYRALEYLPLLILIMLLLACLKIIFDWDGKAWFKRIKYILIWIALMILSIYTMNIISTIFVWYPILKLNFHL